MTQHFFKSIVTFKFQFYLKCNLGTTLTAALSRLILSSHNIFIETGRWRRPHCIPREDRKCITCNTIEDEYHFVIECSIFTDLRKRYISKYYWTNPSMYKLKQLLLHQCFQTQKIKYIFFKSFLIKIQFTKIISVEKDKIYMSIL